jgi:hypothetical protein
MGAEAPAGDPADGFPVHEASAGSAQDLALGDGGPHRQQAADDDPDAEAAGITCHLSLRV